MAQLLPSAVPFMYADSFSSGDTWGTANVPIEGDSVVVKEGFVLLID